jgi:hypothetical protein
LKNISPKPPLMFLNDTYTLSMRKSTKQEKIQVADMETLTKIIPIVSNYIVLIEKEFLLKRSSQIIRKQISKTYTTTFDLTSNMSLSLI